MLTLCSFVFEWVITLNWHNELLRTESVVSRRHIFIREVATNCAFSKCERGPPRNCREWIMNVTRLQDALTAKMLK